ncbi:MAG: hypothetical protein LBJ82_05010, partial [Deltaproteobacteria bacterium]|nr:hypothetical protein [Deltaproteobacteria bacterium]
MELSFYFNDSSTLAKADFCQGALKKSGTDFFNIPLTEGIVPGKAPPGKIKFSGLLLRRPGPSIRK